MSYLTDHQAKQMIIDIGKRMFSKNFVAANDGNISCRVAEDLIWCTPTGVSKGFITEDMLVKIDRSGKVLSGNLRPSSEIMMHLRVYQENPEVMGVTHAHPPISTAFSIAGIALDQAIYPEALVNLGTVPVAHYATPGTLEVPESIAPYCKNYNAVLLANHGALTWGKTLMDAWYRMEALEHYALILMYTGNIIGKANVLSCDQVSDLLEIRSKLGITAGGVPPCAEKPSNTKDVISSHTLPSPNDGNSDRVLKTSYKPSTGGLNEAELAAIVEKVTKQVIQALH